MNSGFQISIVFGQLHGHAAMSAIVSCLFTIESYFIILVTRINEKVHVKYECQSERVMITLSSLAAL